MNYLHRSRIMFLYDGMKRRLSKKAVVLRWYRDSKFDTETLTQTEPKVFLNMASCLGLSIERCADPVVNSLDTGMAEILQSIPASG